MQIDRQQIMQIDAKQRQLRMMLIIGQTLCFLPFRIDISIVVQECISHRHRRDMMGYPTYLQVSPHTPAEPQRSLYFSR